MKKRNKEKIPLAIIILIIVIIGVVIIFPKFKNYFERKKIEYENKKTIESINKDQIIIPTLDEDSELLSLPAFLDESEEQSENSISDISIPIPRTAESPTTKKNLPEKAYLEVPFICQAPLETEANWVYHEESCEEAAFLQAYLFEKNETTTKAEANEIILDMIDWQEDYFGTHKDLYADEMKEFILNYYDLTDSEVKIIKDASIQDIKKLIVDGHPVIVPVTSGLLNNPYYPHPGYHMLTVIGYTEEKIITNDNGTRRGKDFSYDIDEFEKAMKDADGDILYLELL